LSCGPGTTTNTYRTYGKAGSLLTSDAVGGFYFSSIDTATADNQSPSNQVRIIGTSGATRWITLTGSAGGNPTIGTSAGSLNVAPSNGTVQVSGTGNAQLSISAAAASTALHTFSVGGVETARITSADGNNLYLGLGSTSAAQVRIDYTASANRYITLTGSNGGNPTIGTSGGSLAISSALVLSQTTLLSTSVSLTNGAAAAAGTITNAPSAGNPTKWIPINDNGTTRYIPAW
jgi:hypothetical protein